MKQQHIRNFSIIAHIDHGKSTIADRFLEITKAVASRDMKEQVLDDMDLERERGITIKAHPVRLEYKAKDGNVYILNLIDTPGHVDFSYEVSRSLAACEGALLVVDATQGVEAQTIANTMLALEHDLAMIPLANKIDMPSADVEHTIIQLHEALDFDPEEVISASAKTGIGAIEALEAIIEKVPPPEGDPEAPLRALVFDSVFDSYRGAISYVRVIDGKLTAGTQIKMMTSGETFEVTEIGVFEPKPTKVKELGPGEVGYVIAGIKDIRKFKIGDTITTVVNPATEALPGYSEAKPMVYCGLYPVDPNAFEELREALNKLRLNDASFTFEPETSPALGFGFRAGFLGTLHMEIIQERLEREFEIDLIITAPNVIYKAITSAGETVMVENPSKLPPPGKLASIEEPFIDATLLVLNDFVGPVMQLCQNRRGSFKHMEYLDVTKVMLHYEMPLSEIIHDFHDKLKSISKGYASLDYHIRDYRQENLIKLDILINGEPVDALSLIIHRDKAFYVGQDLTSRMKNIVPRQMYEVAIQAAIGNKVIARTNIRALRKNVTAKCYGGDITRKRKLLERQKEGKKRMKQVGKIEIPQEAFLAILDSTS